jgi:hypothetical protein
MIDSWKCWIVIAPWEIGVRVRLGKNAVSLRSGLHLRIPFIDAITLVNTRLRIDVSPPVAVASHGTFTRYIITSVGYRISDPLKAMLKFGHPQAAVVTKAQGEISLQRDENRTLLALSEYFDSESGVTIEFVKFVEDVEVKTYRLINGSSWGYTGHELTGANGSPSLRY